MPTRATHKHLFYSEIAKLLEAGFDIRKAAAVLRNTDLPTAQAALLTDLNAGLESGETITSAFGKNPNRISDLERSIIGAGERGGKLAPAFHHLADYFELIASVRREIRVGMIYPIVVLHLGIFIAVVPTALMSGTRTPLQVFTTLVLTLLAAYAAVIVIYGVIRLIVRRTPTDAATDQLINRLPWIGKARVHMAMARFCKVYHSCLLASIPMAETVRLASQAAQSGRLLQAGKHIESLARAGGPLGPGFIAESAFPKTFARSYATGEEAGTLDSDLARWSSVFQSDARNSSRTVSVMVPKVLYFIILIFVAWKIVSFFNSYYNGLLEMMPD